MRKGSARKQATVTQRPTTSRHALTLTRQELSTGEPIVLPLQPNTRFTFAGRKHRMLMYINQHGEVMMRFIRNDRECMMILGHTDETSVYLWDDKMQDAGHFTMTRTGEVECTICKTSRHIEPPLELMTDEAIACALNEGVGKFATRAPRNFLDVPPQAWTAFHRQLAFTREQKEE